MLEMETTVQALLLQAQTARKAQLDTGRVRVDSDTLFKIDD